MPELKHCPFCGGEAKLVKDMRYPGNSQGIDAWHVTCPNWDCVIYGVDKTYFRRRYKAIEAWNRRANDETDPE